MVACASMFISAASLITMDVMKILRPELPDRQLVRIGRISTTALMIFAVTWAPELHRFESLWQYLQAVLAYSVPPVVAVFLAGLFWRHATAAGAAAAFRVGFCGGAVLFVCNVVLGLTHFHFLYAAPMIFLLALAVMIGVSWRAPEALSVRRAAVMWQPSSWRKDQIRLNRLPIWRDYRYQSVALLLLTALIVLAFR